MARNDRSIGRVAEAFEVFNQRIEPGPFERAEVARHHGEVRRCMRSSFAIAHDFVTGSHARHTDVRPLKDLDILFVMDEPERGWLAREPGDLLEAIRASLAANGGEDRARVRGRCVTLEVARAPGCDEDGPGRPLKIDVVPAFAVAGGYRIGDRPLGRWIEAAPEAHIALAAAKDLALGGRWVPLVRMLKRWNRAVGKPIKPGFLIEAMAHDLVEGPITSCASALCDFFASARVGVARDWPDPSGRGPMVSEGMTEPLRRAAADLLGDAHTRARLAIDLERQGLETDAVAAWSGIMGAYFPAS